MDSTLYPSYPMPTPLPCPCSHPCPHALLTASDATLSHKRLGHLHMQDLESQHCNGVASVHALGSLVNTIACDSCLLHKAHAASRNSTPCTKPSPPLLHMSSQNLKYLILKFEVVYNNTKINRLWSLGPPCYAKLGLISLGYTVNH
jgi:hypothetical protein